MPYKAKGNCVYKLTKTGKLGAQVGCTKGDVKKYMGALYTNDPKAAKNELAEIINAFEVNKKHEALMAEISTMHETVKSMYEGMDHITHEERLSEIGKMHEDMKRLYADIAKLEK